MPIFFEVIEKVDTNINDITKEEMSDIHMMAWKKKLKTLYYCRTKAAVKANIGTGGEMPLNAIPIRQKIEYDETVCRS
jgi:ribonucleoside-diphosphate reductase alpha chain